MMDSYHCSENPKNAQNKPVGFGEPNEPQDSVRNSGNKSNNLTDCANLWFILVVISFSSTTHRH